MFARFRLLVVVLVDMRRLNAGLWFLFDFFSAAECDEGVPVRVRGVVGSKTQQLLHAGAPVVCGVYIAHGKLTGTDTRACTE